MSIQWEVFRRLRLKWTAVLVIAASWIGGPSLEAEASWFPQDQGIAPVDSEAPTTPNTDQAAVVKKDDEGSGSSESVDANADPSDVEADASGDESEEGLHFSDILADVELAPLEAARDRDQRRIERRKWGFKQFVWIYPLGMALMFGVPRLFDRHHKYRRQFKPSLFLIICFPMVYTKVGLVLSAFVWMLCVGLWLSGKLS